MIDRMSGPALRGTARPGSPAAAAQKPWFWVKTVEFSQHLAAVRGETSPATTGGTDGIPSPPLQYLRRRLPAQSCSLHFDEG